MIKILSLRVREFRGIRDAEFVLGGKNLVVRGPNGSGKSGVVDAIQFALTGEIGRLSGAGTGDLTIAEYGPHVTHRDRPESAVVELTVRIPQLGKDARIARSISKARQPAIDPDEPEVRAVFAELDRHPEITLARRDIIKLILTAGTDRSKAVQTLLHQDQIDRTRRALRTTDNKLGETLAEAKRKSASQAETLRRHLGVSALEHGKVLGVVNARRRTLGLSELSAWSKDSILSEGVQVESAVGLAAQVKATALADLDALSEATRDDAPRASDRARQELQELLARFERDPNLLRFLRESELTQLGLDLLHGPVCPLCDLEWDEASLRRHLEEKRAMASEARSLEKRLLRLASQVALDVQGLGSLLDPLSTIPELSEDGKRQLSDWRKALNDLAKDLTTVAGILARKGALGSGWALPDSLVKTDLEHLRTKVLARPERGALGEARDFLVVAQERFADLQQAKRAEQRADSDATWGRLAYKVYCEVMEGALQALYAEIESDFVAYYRALNLDDEAQFKASLSPSEGALDLSVDFHGKGMFPPAAYHSEGHQDGMGLCLYLALLKRVLGGGFTLGVLDDVVMSVDAEHRRRICKLLREQFAETQFVITTHDQVWASQMMGQGLVTGDRIVALQGWNVETGPVLDAGADVWERIEMDLKGGDVPGAAARLRRFFEFASRELANSLGAKVGFKADGMYDPGELLDAVLKRYGELLESAAKVANVWKNPSDLAKAKEAAARHSLLRQAQSVERWAVNPSVHYNEWANFTVSEFRAVVGAFRDLFSQFQCHRVECNSWLTVARVNPQALRCSCGAVQFNLQKG